MLLANGTNLLILATGGTPAWPRSSCRAPPPGLQRPAAAGADPDLDRHLLRASPRSCWPSSTAPGCWRGSDEIQSTTSRTAASPARRASTPRRTPRSRSKPRNSTHRPPVGGGRRRRPTGAEHRRNAMSAPVATVTSPRLPSLLPMLGAALAFVLSRHTNAQRLVSIAALGADATLECCCWPPSGTAARGRQLGGWLPPWGIMLVVDQFSSLMLVVSSAVSLACWSTPPARAWPTATGTRPVSIFHPTYLILVAGVSNAFLAGDLFNLYVGLRDPADRQLRADDPGRHRRRASAPASPTWWFGGVLGAVPDRDRHDLRAPPEP